MNFAMLTASNVIDMTAVENLLGLVRAVMGLFTDFPLNIMLIASLCGVAFGLFKGAKSAV